jgi:hypothetical protein
MNTPVFVPTEAEQSFVLQFIYEISNHPDKLPAVTWLNSHGLHWNLLAGFQRWQVTHGPEFMSKIEFPESLPPFELPWGSPSEFLDQVEASLVTYPDLSNGATETFRQELAPPQPGRARNLSGDIFKLVHVSQPRTNVINQVWALLN